MTTQEGKTQKGRDKRKKNSVSEQRSTVGKKKREIVKMRLYVVIVKWICGVCGKDGPLIPSV